MASDQEQQAPPRVSVLLVSFNNAPALRRCLKALEASSDPATIETILVDNGSSDECSRLDEEFPNLHLHRLPRSFGQVKALNIAMRTARGEFFFFLDPAAEVAPATLAGLTALLDGAPEAVAACPTLVTPAGEVLTRLHPLPLPAEMYQACRDGEFSGWMPPEAAEQPLEVDFLQPPVFLARSYFLRGLRFLDERYGQHWWDLEICTQIRRASKKILLDSKQKVIMHSEDHRPRLSAGTRGLLAADRTLGAALWIGKHYGGWPGWQFRFRATWLAFGRAAAGLLTFRDLGFRLAFLKSFLGGEKLDGSQPAL